MKIRNIFTLCLIIFPILMTYETPIKGIAYGDLILLLLYPFLFYKIISEKRKVKDIVYFPLVILFLYLLVYYLLLAFIDAKLFSETSIKFIHNLFYLFTLSFFVKSFYDIDIGYKVLKVVSIVATFFLFIQIMGVTIFHIYIPGTLPGVPVMRDELELFNETVMGSNMVIRPRSIFNEPAEYATYTSLFLAVELFLSKKEHKSIRNYWCEIIVTIGLVVSKSSTGIVCAFFLWCVYLMIRIKKNHSKKELKKMMVLLVLGVICIVIFFKSSAFEYFINKTYSMNNEWGYGVLGRFENYDKVFSLKDLTVSQIIFGNAMINTIYYIPGIPRIFLYFGIIGVLIYSLIYLYIVVNSDSEQKVILLLMLFIAFAGDTIFGVSGMYFYPFIINKIRGENEIKCNL